MVWGFPEGLLFMDRLHMLSDSLDAGEMTGLEESKMTGKLSEGKLLAKQA